MSFGYAHQFVLIDFQHAKGVGIVTVLNYFALNNITYIRTVMYKFVYFIRYIIELVNYDKFVSSVYIFVYNVVIV